MQLILQSENEQLKTDCKQLLTSRQIPFEIAELNELTLPFLPLQNEVLLSCLDLFSRELTSIFRQYPKDSSYKSAIRISILLIKAATLNIGDLLELYHTYYKQLIKQLNPDTELPLPASKYSSFLTSLWKQECSPLQFERLYSYFTKLEHQLKAHILEEYYEERKILRLLAYLLSETYNKVGLSYSEQAMLSLQLSSFFEKLYLTQTKQLKVIPPSEFYTLKEKI